MIKTFKPEFTITNKITTGLTRIERARGFLDAATLSEDWVREMYRRALILEAHHTYLGNTSDFGSGRATTGRQSCSRGRFR